MLQNKNIELRAFAELLDLMEKDGLVLIGYTFKKATITDDEITMGNGIKTVPSQMIAALLTDNNSESEFTKMMMIDPDAGKPTLTKKSMLVNPFTKHSN